MHMQNRFSCNMWMIIGLNLPNSKLRSEVRSVERLMGDGIVILTVIEYIEYSIN